jgi:hypothetical protein
MQTLRLTRADFKKSDWYWSDYVGKYDVSEFDGNIEIDANLGCVSFAALSASGSITALSCTGMKVDRGIDAGANIKSDWGIYAGAGIRTAKGLESGGDIKVGEDIEAGWSIVAAESIEAKKNIRAGTTIKAGTGIKAGGNIEAGAGIKAGWRIEAGRDIKAGEGIEAGLAIECKGTLNVKLRVFAGLCLWRAPRNEEKTIICSKFEGGVIDYGTLIERE